MFQIEKVILISDSFTVDADRMSIKSKTESKNNNNGFTIEKAENDFDQTSIISSCPSAINEPNNQTLVQRKYPSDY